MSTQFTTELPLALQEFHDDVLNGLAEDPKTLPSKYFYDRRGSQLFDQICELPEYYPTRTEIAIMQSHACEMADHIGPGALVVELGSGSSTKTGALLKHLSPPTCYVPVDISGEHLFEAADRIAEQYPNLLVRPLHADFTQAIELPEVDFDPERTVAYFPGSTIGNFAPADAEALLERISALVRPHGGLLIGFDLIKAKETLELAYNDSQHVTAAFNLNILARINRELGGDFDLATFRHRAHYNREDDRIEMHLISQADQTVVVGKDAFEFQRGESICTEYSHKYSIDSFANMAARAGFGTPIVWTDPQNLFAVCYLALE